MAGPEGAPDLTAPLRRLPPDRSDAAAHRDGPRQPPRACPAGPVQLLVGAFGTAAFALTTDTIWQMGDALGPLCLTVIMLLGLTALVAWLIIAHDLWEKPDRHTTAELARLFNLGPIFTLTLATTVSYVVLFAGTALAAALLIDTSVLEQTLQRPVQVTDYLTLAWIHQLPGHRRRSDRLRARGRGRGASSRLRTPSRTRRLAGREGPVTGRTPSGDGRSTVMPTAIRDDRAQHARSAR